VPPGAPQSAAASSTQPQNGCGNCSSVCKEPPLGSDPTLISSLHMSYRHNRKMTAQESFHTRQQPQGRPPRPWSGVRARSANVRSTTRHTLGPDEQQASEANGAPLPPPPATMRSGLVQVGRWADLIAELLRARWLSRPPRAKFGARSGARPLQPLLAELWEQRLRRRALPRPEISACCAAERIAEPSERLSLSAKRSARRDGACW
jgi:hypothetical protein